MPKIKVLESFEQGAPKAAGGALKMRAGEYQADAVEGGFMVEVEGRKRTMPDALIAHLKSLKLIAVE